MLLNANRRHGASDTGVAVQGTVEPRHGRRNSLQNCINQPRQERRWVYFTPSQEKPLLLRAWQSWKLPRSAKSCGLWSERNGWAELWLPYLYGIVLAGMSSIFNAECASLSNKRARVSLGEAALAIIDLMFNRYFGVGSQKGKKFSLPSSWSNLDLIKTFLIRRKEN